LGLSDHPDCRIDGGNDEEGTLADGEESATIEDIAIAEYNSLILVKVQVIVIMPIDLFTFLNLLHFWKFLMISN
jgi:hypothetical protein